MVGVPRGKTLPAKPRAVGKPSDQPVDGLWQVAQDIVPPFDRCVSKNSRSPSSTLAGVGSLPDGYGTGGKRQRSSSAVGPSGGAAAIEASAVAASKSGTARNILFSTASFP